MLTFLTKLRFNSGSLLRSPGDDVGRTMKKKKRKKKLLSGLEYRTKPRWKEKKEECNEINNFPEFKVFCRRHFSLVSSSRHETGQRGRERGRESMFFFLLLRENEIDPLHSRLEENRNPRPPFTRQFSFTLLTSLLHFLC